MSTTTTISDVDLVERAYGGDLDALRIVIDRHLHPAWRIATVAADPARAEAATIEGFTTGLLAAHRHPEPNQTLRLRLVGATRRAAAQSGDAPVATPTPESEADADAPSGDPVLVAFLALPEKSRTALWLTEVEGGTPEQVAPVLGLDRSAAAALSDRAAAALRDRLAATVAARADDDDCRRALSKLPAHAAGKLTSAERDLVGAHVGSCGNCAVWLAALVSPRPALRRLVAEPPATLAAAIEARWVELLERERKGWLAPFTERAVGAAAAAVLAIGLGGVAFLGDRDDDGDDDRRSELAMPASADPGDDGSDDGSDDVAVEPPPPTRPTTPPPTTAGTTSSSTSGSASPAASTGTAAPVSTAPGDRPRGIGDPIPNPPAEEPPTGPPAGDPPPPTPDESTTQIAITALQGLVAIGVGDCTGLTIVEVHSGCVPLPNDAPLSVTIDLPGLPPIGI